MQERVHGVPVALAADFVDRNTGHHRLKAAGPHLYCAEHRGTIEKEGVAEALAALSHARTCARYSTAWQRIMLADDDNYVPVIRVLPKPFLEYHREQTVLHGRRLDAALAPDTLRRDRRRWHTVGWRATPSLAAAYQAVGVEAGLAFVAMRNRVAPDDIEAALADPRNPVAIALRDGGSQHLKLLNLGLQTRVTDDFPYEPLDGPPATVPWRRVGPAPAPVAAATATSATATSAPTAPGGQVIPAELLEELAGLEPEEVAARIRAWAEGEGAPS